MMRARWQTLARRIVMAYVLMTVIVAGLFSLLVIHAVSYAEDFFAAQTMASELDEIVGVLDSGLEPRIDKNMKLYVVPRGQTDALPDWLAPFEPGFREIDHLGEELHVLVRDVAGTRYVLVQDLDEFEQRERVLAYIVSSAFLLSILAAWLVGTLMARRSIAPVIRLAGQVAHRDQLLPIAPPLAGDYADDEVGQLAAAFDSTLGKLRQALERERLFTSDVSHELRTPLMVIASTCDLLLAQGIADARQGEKIARMRAGCAEMQELVEVFLQLARTTGDKADSAWVALEATAQEQFDRWRDEAQARGLDLRLIREGDDTGQYPAPQLRTVISNLLRNALHYTDRGFVEIVLRAGGFGIRDSGAGVPPERRDEIFRPFVRGDRQRGDGLGLGLSLVNRICQQQGWCIRLDERVGGGCEFSVSFSGS